ncbi:FAD-binding Berberine family protein [Heracleum sosnowskyi]|uniref:FAD-binding Berberine family protein n=1 Tax=Heracleum sosnowskyi TaxID=360622 RepID=A0AAD8I4K6_9APIA|nr:FAD-binding Berberine family protein [Heracleum sosnowskyi]
MAAASKWDYINLLFLRPILAILFVFSLLVLGWYLAWKLVLVHVPLVQEIFGLRKKTFTPKPPSRRRLSKFYNSLNSRDSTDNFSGFHILTLDSLNTVLPL